MAPKVYSANKLKKLFAEAQELGIATRKNMTGPTLERKIAELKDGAAPAAAATKAKPGPKAGATRGGRKPGKFLLYVVDHATNELSFAVEQDGPNGPAAATAAVQAGLISPDTPIVALAPSVLEGAVEVETSTVFTAKAATAKKAPAAAKPAGTATGVTEATAAAPVPVPAAKAKTAAKKAATPAKSARSARKAPAKPAETAAVAPTPPEPGVSPSNPFAG